MALESELNTVETHEPETLVETSLAEVESLPAVETLPVESPPPAEPEPVPVKPAPVAAGVCPECFQSGFKNEQALNAHVRFKHTLPRARKEAAAKKAAGPQIPPPDFSDIPGAAPAAPASPVAVLPDQRYEGMANMTFDMTTGLLTRIFGPEWQPKPDADNKDVSHERMAVVACIKNYYESVKLPDIPPGYMLCFVALAYAAPRMAEQPTKTKLQMGWLWLKSKFQRRQLATMPHIVKP